MSRRRCNSYILDVFNVRLRLASYWWFRIIIKALLIDGRGVVRSFFPPEFSSQGFPIVCWRPFSWNCRTYPFGTVIIATAVLYLCQWVHLFSRRILKLSGVPVMNYRIYWAFQHMIINTGASVRQHNLYCKSYC